MIEMIMIMSFWKLYVLVDEEEKDFLQKIAGVDEKRFTKLDKKYGVTLVLQETKALYSFRKRKKFKQNKKEV